VNDEGQFALNSKIRVVIADDHPYVREVLSNILSRQQDIELVGQAADGKEAYELTRALKPDVLVLDFEMPQVNGLEVAGRLLGEGTTTAIILFSAHSDPVFIKATLIKGVRGFVVKDEGPENLLQAIRRLFHPQYVGKTRPVDL
jgi:DNA-binding NarL/FixJ family response regulator